MTALNKPILITAQQINSIELDELLKLQNRAASDGFFASQLLSAMDEAEYADTRFGEDGARKLSKGWDAVTQAAFLHENFQQR